MNNNTAHPAVFTFESHPVRTLDRNGEVWFVAGDVCESLGLPNVGQALSRLEDDEKSSVIIDDGTPGNPNRAIISEPGLYRLTLTSRKPEAKRFTRWVTHEVLPAIRQTGRYEHDAPPVGARLLLVINEGRVVSSTAVSETACIVEPADRASLETLVREFVPRRMLPCLMAGLTERMTACLR